MSRHIARALAFVIMASAATLLGACPTRVDSMSEKPNTSANARPFNRTNENINGDIGVQTDTGGGIRPTPANQRPTKVSPPPDPESQPYPPPVPLLDAGLSLP